MNNFRRNEHRTHLQRPACRSSCDKMLLPSYRNEERKKHVLGFSKRPVMFQKYLKLPMPRSPLRTAIRNQQLSSLPIGIPAIPPIAVPMAPMGAAPTAPMAMPIPVILPGGEQPILAPVEPPLKTYDSQRSQLGLSSHLKKHDSKSWLHPKLLLQWPWWRSNSPSFQWVDSPWGWDRMDSSFQD